MACASIIVIFSFIRVTDDSPWFTLRNERAPFVFEYQLVYSIWVARAELSMGAASRKYAAATTEICTRVGFGFLVPAGLAFGFLALASDLLFGASALLAPAYPELVDPIMTFTAATLLSFLGLCIGSTMPVWGPCAGVPALQRWLRRYILYHRMYPLWLTLYRCTPWISLTRPRSRFHDLFALDNLEFRYYRRIVEILDARLAVRNFASAEIANAACAVCEEDGFPECEHAFVAAAAGLTLAANARMNNRASQHPHLPQIPVSTGVDDEADALAHVARYCTKATLMSRISARFEAMPTSSPQAAAV